MRDLSAWAIRAVTPQRESRLVLRVLEIWREAHGENDLPLTGSIAIADFGLDAPHVFVLDVEAPADPQFSVIGPAVSVAGWPGSEAPLLATCPDDSVLAQVAQHWREIVERRVPVTRGGIGVNEGTPILYRGILMPLIDEKQRVCRVIGAANWRAVEESHGARSN